MWGRDSPNSRSKPHTCTIGRKVWLSDHGGCTVTDISGWERRSIEGRLKACGAMGTDDKISGAIESVSFDDTLREIERVIIGDLTDDLTSMVNSINMYEEIMEFEQMIGSGQTTPIDTKYKTVD